jgi:hypothetical protein
MWGMLDRSTRKYSLRGRPLCLGPRRYTVSPRGELKRLTARGRSRECPLPSGRGSVVSAAYGRVLPAGGHLPRAASINHRQAGEASTELGYSRTLSRTAVRLGNPLLPYDEIIVMPRTQIILESEIQSRARQRASDLGVSLGEYVRRLVARDLGDPQSTANPAVVFDLGASHGSDIAQNKDAMVAAAFASGRRKSRRREIRQP